MLGFLLQTINSWPTIPNALADRLKVCHKLNVQNILAIQRSKVKLKWYKHWFTVDNTKVN